jgi:photosystem II stability/assembly factor-like uncharacterized protein
MSSQRACLAKTRPGAGISVSARRSAGTFGPWFIKGLLAGAAFLAGAGGASAAPDTDTAIWRAQHGLLLGVTRAGGRIVAVGNDGNVLLSDDEGVTWRLAKPATDELLTSVVFPTPKEGWAVGQDETVLHSTDGGATWTRQYLKAAADQVLFTVISLAPGHLFSSGSYNLILETQDGGANWKESKIDNLDDDYHLNCAVNRGDDVMVTGEGGHAFIRYAGAWTAMKLPYDGSQFACALGADGSFYSFGLRGTAFRALPGEKVWTKLDSATQRSFFGAANLANGRIALVGSNGLVELLDTASGKMTALPRPTAQTLSGVVEAKDGKLIIVGDDGVHLVDPAAAADAGVSQ